MNYGFDQMFTKAQEAAAPLSEITEFGFQAFEKAVEMQAALLGDALDFAAEQMKVLSMTSNPSEYFQAQTKLAEETIARMQKRAEGLVASATETQATLATWAERGVQQAQASFEETYAVAKAAAPKQARKKGA